MNERNCRNCKHFIREVVIDISKVIHCNPPTWELKCGCYSVDDGNVCDYYEENSSNSKDD